MGKLLICGSARIFPAPKGARALGKTDQHLPGGEFLTNGHRHSVTEAYLTLQTFS